MSRHNSELNYFCAHLHKLSTWCSTWGMKLNPQKSCYMVFKKYLPLNSNAFDYNINGNILQKVDQFKDLGVLVLSNFSWSGHIKTCLTRANQRLGLVKRILGFNMKSEIIGINESFSHNTKI